MKFCKMCKNMMLLTSDDVEVVAQYKCPCCENVEKIAAKSSTLILTRRPRNTDSMYKKYATDDLRHDPTLPLAEGVSCPFCEKAGHIVYVKFSEDLKYIYMCKACARFWQNSKGVVGEVHKN